MNKDTTIHSGSHLKKIISKGSWYFIASVITKALAIIMWPITTRYLSPNDIGVLDSLDSIRLLLPIFISLCLDEAYYRFYFNHNKTFNELKKYISTYFWIIICWGIVVLLIGTLIGRIYLTKLFDVPFYPYILITMLGPLLLQLSLLGGVYLKQRLKSEFYSITQVVVYGIFYAVFLFLLVIPKIGAQAKIYGLFISDILSVVIFSFVIFKNKLVGFQFDKRILIEGLKYSIPLLPCQGSYWITGLSDRIIIGIYKTFASTGIYSIGYKLGQTLTMFSESIFKVYKPIIFSMFADNKENAVKKIENFIPAFFFIMFWLAFCIGIFSKEAVFILTESKFHNAYLVTPIVVCAYFFSAMYKPFYHILSYYKKTWTISIGALIQASSNIVFNIIFIPIFGRMAAAVTTLFSYIVFFIWLFLWSQKFEKIKIDWGKILKTIFIGIIIFILYIVFSRIILLTFLLNLFLKILLVLCALFISLKLGLIKMDFFKIKK